MAADKKQDYSVDDLTRIEIPPMASDRMHKLPPYLFGRINALKRQLRTDGVDVIDLGMGNPSDPTPQPIVDKLNEAARDKRNQRYTVASGIPNLRREITKFYQREWNVSLDPETEAIATIGSKEGFSHLCLGTLGPGDVALVPTPAFPIHTYGPIIAGANVIGVSQNDGEEALLKSIDNMCRTLQPVPKLLILNYPNNPTARVVEIGFFQEIVRMAKKYGFYVIHDFAYGMTSYNGYKAPSFLEVPGARDVGVETITMSKGFNMAGWRVGFVLGNKDMIRILANIKGYYDYGIFQPIQIATVIALRECGESMRQQAGIYEERANFLQDGLIKMGWDAPRSLATMFSWVPIPEPYRKLGSIEFVIQCLKKADVALAPGLGFGNDGEGFVRIALVENKQRTQQALRQLKKAFPL